MELQLLLSIIYHSIRLTMLSLACRIGVNLLLFETDILHGYRAKIGNRILWNTKPVGLQTVSQAFLYIKIMIYSLSNIRNKGERTMANIRSKVALLSVISNSFLITIKAIAGFLSGSVSILSEAIHSAMDLLASFIALFSVTYAYRPADKKHPYGHGKMENISGVIEGLLIFIAAALIIKEAVGKLLHPEPLQQEYLAITVMAVSAIVNFFISSILYRVAKREDSIALEADALHLKTDVYTSAGVAIGLVLMKITGLYWLDPVVAILVAGLIVKEAYELVSTAFSPLLDAKLPDAEEAVIKEVLEKYEQLHQVTYHDLKTRKAGSARYVDFHLEMASDITVSQSHEICDQIEMEITGSLPQTSVNIHVEPKLNPQ